jgi:hypothetical protein
MTKVRHNTATMAQNHHQSHAYRKGTKRRRLASGGRSSSKRLQGVKAAQRPKPLLLIPISSHYQTTTERLSTVNCRQRPEPVVLLLASLIPLPAASSLESQGSKDSTYQRNLSVSAPPCSSPEDRLTHLLIDRPARDCCCR